MARTLSQIYSEIITEKDTLSELSTLQPNADTLQTFLADLTTTSKVATWRIWAYLFAFEVFAVEKYWDIFKAEVEALIAQSRPGTLRWYQEQALNFQYGYTLVYNNGKYQYSVVDEDAKIVKKCAVIESNSQLITKVAKADGSLLSAPELAAFSAYMQQIKFAGTNSLEKSQEPDDLKLVYRVYYDPLVLNSTGKLLTDLSKEPAKEAVESYIANLPFNGELVLTQLTDAVQQAVGVKNPVLLSAEARYGVIPFTTINDAYLTDSGQLSIDTLTINYIPAS